MNQKQVKFKASDPEETLIRLIRREPFEAGMSHRASDYAEKLMYVDPDTARHSLLAVFHQNCDDREIVLGILWIIGRLEYDDIGPAIEEIAVMSLRHSDIEIVDTAVGAIESWDQPSHARVLSGVEVSCKWLQEYIDEVAEDLRRLR